MPYNKTTWVNGDTDVNATQMNKIEKGIAIANSQAEVKTATGTGNVIVVSDFGIDSYFNGLKVTFIAPANNNGAATTINIDGRGAKSIYKPNTTSAPKFIAGKAYTIYFSGSSFFWQASAEGNAVAANVLAGTTFSNDDDTGIAGTMIDRAGDTAALSIARSGTTIRLRASDGFRDGTNDFVTHTDPNDVANNYRQGVTIRGLTGTLKPEVLIKIPRSVNASYQMMAADVEGNTYWGSKWVYDRYSIYNKDATLLRSPIYTASDAYRFLGCGVFGYTKTKNGTVGSSAVVQHYLENGTLVREFTKGLSDNSDPYLFTGTVYVAVVDQPSSTRGIAIWNSSGVFVGVVPLKSSNNYILNTQNTIVCLMYNSVIQSVLAGNNAVTETAYGPNSQAWIDYLNFTAY